MKKMIRPLSLLIAILLALAPVLSYAQFTDPDDVVDNPVPFDNGVPLLLVSAVAYGIKKVNEKKKQAEFLK
ncbi:MAG: hypothetical protein M3040_09035 [Bacteroidota bacterium]|nr:hypothetical protein [Bacteroidota bacterium]